MKKPASVDHKRIADLCARHRSNDYYTVVDRFCEAQGLSARDKLRIRRLAEQQAIIEKALDREGLALQGYLKGETNA